MKYLRLISGMGLVALACAGLGCNQKAAILPTDEHSKEIASQPPPPIIGMGGPSNNSVNNTAQPQNQGKQQPGKTKLRGVQ